MKRILQQLSMLGCLALGATFSLRAQPEPQPADPASAERVQWQVLHRAVQSTFLTEAACSAKFGVQLRDARSAAQVYLSAVAAGYLTWAREREEGATRPPELPRLDEAQQLLAAEAEEAQLRLKELDLIRALDPPIEAVRQSQERTRFDWRPLPDAAAGLEALLAKLASRTDGVQGLLRVQESHLQAELLALQTYYDLVETEVSRRCTRPPTPKTEQDPFVVPDPPAQSPAPRKKN